MIDLYKKALKVLLVVDGSSAFAMEFLLKLLKTAEAAGDVAKVKEEAMLACVTAMKTPETYKCDELLDFASVQQLSSDKKGAKVIELLRIFVSEQVAAYKAFADANAAFIEKQGLGACLDKMRLLSVVSMATAAAAQSSSELPYELVAKTLGIESSGGDADDELPAWVIAVEDWIIKAIAAGLIEARLDQVSQQSQQRGEQGGRQPGRCYGH